MTDVTVDPATAGIVVVLLAMGAAAVAGHLYNITSRKD